MSSILPTIHPPSNLQADYYKYLCGASARKMSLIWSLLNVTVGICLLSATWIDEKFAYAQLGEVLICLGILLLIGYVNMIWWLYLPSMLFAIVAIVYFVCMGVYKLGLGVTIFFLDPEQYRYWLNPEQQVHPDIYRSSLAWKMIGTGFGCLIGFLVFTYFLNVLVRACQMVDLLARHHPIFWSMKRQKATTAQLV
ncbi:hypothetical protein M3Y97_00943700 [Aphelenchoides bicaudatus]|nr:hypothetical protein M3Y97_00943700 [Aphelenchoides bicaudatus]